MKYFTLSLISLLSLSSLAYERRTLLTGFECESAKKAKVAFFDADSTLRIAPSDSVSANHPTDVEILPNVPSKLYELAQDGYFIAIVSNQGGVAGGHISFEVAEQALAYTVELIEEAGGIVHYMDFAEARDENRKPDIGMGIRVDEILKSQTNCGGLDKNQSFMVGDSAYKKGKDTWPNGNPGTDFSNSDRLFAENFGIPFYYPKTYFGW